MEPTVVYVVAAAAVLAVYLVYLLFVKNPKGSADELRTQKNALALAVVVLGGLNLYQFVAYRAYAKPLFEQELIDRFHELYYDSADTWMSTRWFGVLTAQNPNDVWIHQEIIQDVKPDFIVEAGTLGFEIAERIQVIAPHPLARLAFKGCRIPASQRIGEAGEGFKVAMRTLDVFRTSVAAAALGFARRALDEALQRATTRKMFKQTLADFQLTQAKLAQMATTVDGAALLTYRAAWQRDQGRTVTREAAMAKMAATEGAQQVIDAAVQMWGGLGVVSEQPVERLYREIRALRIYEGATEVQQLIIARELLKDLAA